MPLPLALLAIILVTLWSSWVSPPVTPYNYHRWVVMGALMVLWALAGWWHRRRVQAALVRSCAWTYSRPGGRWLALVACLLVLAAVLLSLAPWVALLELAHWIAFAMLVLIVAVSVRHASRFQWLLAGGMAVLLLLVYALIALDSINFHWPIFTKMDATPGLANIRHFSDIAVGLMPLGLVYVVARGRLSVAVAFLTALPLGVWWYVLFLTEGRSGVLSLTLAILVAGMLFRRQALWPVATLFLSALPALAAWWWLNPLRLSAPGIFSRDITGTHDRLMLWGEAWQHAIENFPLGIGPMGFAGDGIEDGYRALAHAHNLFLNTAAEWGIPLTVLLLALALFGCWKIVERARSMPETDQPLYACLVMAFVGVMVNVQFSGGHIIPLSSLVMALVIGLVFGFRGLNSLPSATLSPSQSASARPALLWAAGMLVMAYLLFAGWSLYGLSVESTRLCNVELGRIRYFPRFWVQGRLECMRMLAPDHWLFWSWRG
ncbi:O-antigen ligase family protein [Halomonas aquatica]|uniref:O-antigen ligase family protein n=1 Tax=Halomonas aquatica TaxID=3151123 RepID=A0ABV1NHR7_9GAMM